MASITACTVRVDAAATRPSHQSAHRRVQNAIGKNANVSPLRAHLRRRQHVSTTESSSPRVSAASITALEPPALSNPESGARAAEYGARRGAVPYKDGGVDCDIRVNDGATEAIKAAGAERFVRLIDATNPKLVKLLTIMVGRMHS
jgi:hypothetical protein